MPFIEYTYDSYKSDIDISLYGITYRGINSGLIKNRNKVKNYKSNMNNLILLSLIKNILSGFNILYFLYFSIIFLKDKSNKLHFCISIIIIGSLFSHMIILIIYCRLNFSYVQNVLNKINNDFILHRSNYEWTLILIFLDLIFLVIYLCIILYLFMFEKWKWIQDKIDRIINFLTSIKKWFENLKCFNNNQEPSKGSKHNVDKKNYPVNPSYKPANTGSRERPADVERLCQICMENKSEVIFSPCGHRGCCEKCYNDLKKNKKAELCFFCKTKIESVTMRIYDM